MLPFIHSLHLTVSHNICLFLLHTCFMVMRQRSTCKLLVPMAEPDRHCNLLETKLPHPRIQINTLFMGPCWPNWWHTNLRYWQPKTLIVLRRSLMGVTLNIQSRLHTAQLSIFQLPFFLVRQHNFSAESCVKIFGD